MMTYDGHAVDHVLRFPGASLPFLHTVKVIIKWRCRSPGKEASTDT